MPDEKTLTESLNHQSKLLAEDLKFKRLWAEVNALKRRIEVLEGSSKTNTKKG